MFSIIIESLHSKFRKKTISIHDLIILRQVTCLSFRILYSLLILSMLGVRPDCKKSSCWSTSVVKPAYLESPCYAPNKFSSEIFNCFCFYKHINMTHPLMSVWTCFCYKCFNLCSTHMDTLHDTLGINFKWCSYIWLCESRRL